MKVRVDEGVERRHEFFLFFAFSQRPIDATVFLLRMRERERERERESKSLPLGLLVILL